MKLLKMLMFAAVSFSEIVVGQLAVNDAVICFT